MALGNENISVSLVQSTIGVYSTSSVGGLIAKAKVGGVGWTYTDEYGHTITIPPMAFFIYETRDANWNRYDGVLIPGAEPHWNMYSNKIPAEWFNDAGAGNVLNLRLKRNALNANGGYDFRLHDFRGYEHDINAAEKPNLWTSDLEVWEGTTIDVTARFYYGGNMDLSTASRSGMPLTHYVIVFTRGTTVVTSVPIALDNPVDSPVPTITFTANTTTTITMEVFLLPNNIDKGRVKITSQFMNVNGVVNGSTAVSVTVNPYPYLGLDTSAIYEHTVNLDMVLDGTWVWGEYPESEGIASFVDGSGVPIEVQVGVGTLDVLNTAIPMKFWGTGGTRTFNLYKNGLKIGQTVVISIPTAKYPNGFPRSVNFQATNYGGVNKGDFFEIIVT